MTTAAASADPRISNRWLVLALLFCSYALSGADRQMVAVLAEPIRTELGLTDSQLGMLSGFAFALFYTAFAIPIAWLADRTNRVFVVAGSCLAWSLSTAGCGLAANYVQLALWRVGVATGEAGASPSAHSLLSDHFAAEQRGLALGLYSVGLPFGIAAGTAFGGWVGSFYGWREAFFAISLPGIVLSLLLIVLVRNPQAGRLDTLTPASPAAPSFTRTLQTFVKRKVLWQTTFAGCLAALSSYALMVWLPAFLMRAKGMTLIDLAQSYSLLSGIAMVLGMLMSGVLVDRLGRRDARASALIPAWGYLAAAPLVFAAIWVADWHLSLLLLAVPLGLMMTWLPPALTTLQNNAPPEQRGVMSAIFMLFTGIVGNGGGPVLVGLLSDLFTRRSPETSLHLALTAMCPVLVLAAVAHFRLARTLTKASDGGMDCSMSAA